MNKGKKIKSFLDQKNIDKEYDGSYTRVVHGVAGTAFDAYYTKGECVKLTDGALVITVHKPGRCSTSDGYYKHEMIEITAGDRRQMTYADFMSLSRAVEQAIDMLNSEKKNVIDRVSHNEGYNTTRSHKAIVKKSKHAIPQEELEIGGVYVDDRQKAFVYLGEDMDLDYIEGPLLETNNPMKMDIPSNKIEFSDDKFNGKISLGYNIPSNKINFLESKKDKSFKKKSFRIGYDDAHFAYLYYTNDVKTSDFVIFAGNNMIENLVNSKKFYGKIGQLNLNEPPFVIECGSHWYRLSPRIKTKEESQERSI